MFTETTRLHRGHRIFLLFLTLSALFFNAYESWFVLGIHPTDPGAEARRYYAATQIANGNHEFGIVPKDQTHYPNGPAYVIAPWIYAGLSGINTLRWIPFVIAICAQALLFYAIVKSRLTWLRKVLLILGATVLFHQPGIRHWVGALHVQSYSISLTILLAAFAILWSDKLWIFALTGFAAGWIGYDAIPTQATVLLGIAFFYGTMKEDRIAGAAKQSVKLVAVFSAGVFLSVLLHFAQNALFFRSVSVAAADLFGSAGTRMGIDTKDLNPKYYEYIRQATRDEISRPKIMKQTWNRFWRRFASKKEILMIFLLPAVLGVVTLISDARVRKQAFSHSVLLIALCFLTVAIWIWLMPYHAYHHGYYLPRYVLMSLLLLLFGGLFLTSPRNPTEQKWGNASHSHLNPEGNLDRAVPLR